LGKTVADHQRDWDTRLPYAMAAYRASRHESTGYSANFLTLGQETRGPVDVVFGTAESESSTETYDDFVEAIRSRMTTAYSEVRMSLRRSAERNKRYYDCKVRPQKYSVGQWVYYFNPRKFQGKQSKWMRQYSGPYLVIRTPSPVTVEIQRSQKAKSFVVHIDKVKPFLAETPKSWLTEANSVDTEDQQVATTCTANDEVVKDQPNPQVKVRKDNGMITETATPPDDSHVAYTVDEVPFRTRPKRTVRPPKYLEDFQYSNNRIGIIRARSTMRSNHRPNASTELKWH